MADTTRGLGTQPLSLPEEFILMLLNEETGYFHQVHGWELNCLNSMNEAPAINAIRDSHPKLIRPRRTLLKMKIRSKETMPIAVMVPISMFFYVLLDRMSSDN